MTKKSDRNFIGTDLYTLTFPSVLPFIPKGYDTSKMLDDNLIKLRSTFVQKYPEIRGNLQKLVFDTMKDSEIRTKSKEGRSIAWHLWHMSRVEDFGLSRLIFEKEQLFDKGDWALRLNIDIGHIGMDMPITEVEKLNDGIDINALYDYHLEVEKRTICSLDEIDNLQLQRCHNADYLEKVLFVEKGLHKNAKWVKDHYKYKPIQWFLMELLLIQNFGQLGQIIRLRKGFGPDPVS